MSTNKAHLISFQICIPHPLSDELIVQKQVDFILLLLKAHLMLL